MAWLCLKSLLGDLLIEDGVPHNRNRSERDVVQLIEPAFVKGLSTECGNEAVPVLRQDEDDVFVEHVND